MSNAERLIARIEDKREDMRDRARWELQKSIEVLKRQMQFELVKNRSYATGRLYEGLTVTETTGPGEIVGYSIYAPDYWKFLEFGTGIYGSPKRSYKGATPAAQYNNILLWVKEKPIIPDPDGPADTQEELAELIAQSLSKGSHSHPFARPAWRGTRGKRYMLNNVKSGLEKELNS